MITLRKSPKKAIPAKSRKSCLSFDCDAPAARSIVTTDNGARHDFCPDCAAYFVANCKRHGWEFTFGIIR